MNQSERRLFLLQKLLAEPPRRRSYQTMTIPQNPDDQKRLLRALLNIRLPAAVSEEFLSVQDAYLREEIAAKGITELSDLSPVSEGLYLWQGDITTLACDAVVNAANSGLTGCYAPNHLCIDNCIHTYAGVQLRLACAEIIQAQGYAEPTGQAKITAAYNLPCKYVLHTVGPIVGDSVTGEDRKLLASCYRSCLDVARENRARSVAFCCISTGEFHFPNRLAAEIAVRTVQEYKGDIEVIFNVFKDIDYQIYRDLLS